MIEIQSKKRGLSRGKMLISISLVPFLLSALFIFYSCFLSQSSSVGFAGDSWTKAECSNVYIVATLTFFWWIYIGASILFLTGLFFGVKDSVKGELTELKEGDTQI